MDDSTDNDVCVDGGRGAGIWVARNIRYVWNEERIKRVDSGSSGRPSRRVKDGVTNAYWNCQLKAGFRPVRRGTNVGVVVLAEDIEDPTVEIWLDVIKLVDVGMLDRIHNHLAGDHY